MELIESLGWVVVVGLAWAVVTVVVGEAMARLRGWR